MTQYIQLFLKKLSNNHRIPNLFGKLIMISKLLHMNELEITIWSLWLEKLNWVTDGLTLSNFLFVTGAQAKAYTNPGTEMEIYMKKLAHDFPQIGRGYNSWISSKKHIMEFDLIVVNREYNKLKKVF